MRANRSKHRCPALCIKNLCHRPLSHTSEMISVSKLSTIQIILDLVNGGSGATKTYRSTRTLILAILSVL